MITVKITSPDNYYWNTITTKLKMTVSEGIKDVARLACERASRSTFPSGTTNKTKDVLEKSIYKDISHAYLPVANEKLEHDDGSYLFAHRNNKGRVPSTTQRRAISFSNYDNLKDSLVHSAGMVKAGWLDAAKQLKGTVRIPVWLRKNASGLSTVLITDEMVDITNNVSYASNLITDRQLKNLMENAFKGLLKRAERIKL